MLEFECKVCAPGITQTRIQSDRTVEPLSCLGILCITPEKLGNRNDDMCIIFTLF